MLTPEKSTNLIFIGNYDTSLFNYTFYKVDDIKIKENLIILNTVVCVEISPKFF